ncbi:MAG TPA: hypothetical protein VEP67_09175 [Thiobacillaceae bacterium]|nr:hypothetical protein [Thiobacillaceae bacterium]
MLVPTVAALVPALVSALISTMAAAMATLISIVVPVIPMITASPITIITIMAAVWLDDAGAQTNHHQACG